MANIKHYTKIPILPEEYVECEYIEGTGTQWIDTEYRVTTSNRNNIRIEMLGNFGTSSSDSGKWSLDGSAYPQILCYIGIAPTGVVAYGLNDDIKTTYVENDRSGKHLYIVDYKNGVVKRDEYIITSFTNKSFGNYSTPHNLYIYGWSTNRGWSINAKKYSFKIFDDDTAVRNLIPAIRKSDNKPGMYDLVTGKFFTNQGTGEFLYKIAEVPTMKFIPMVQMYHKGVPYFRDKRLVPLLPDEYQEVEYLESTGTQCIDLDIYPTFDVYDIDMIIQQSNPKTGRAFAFSLLQDYNGTYIAARNGNWSFATTELHENSLEKSSISITLDCRALLKATYVINGNSYTYSRTTEMPSLGAYKSSLYSYQTYIYQEFGNFKIYSFKMSKAQMRIFNLVPCYRKSDNVSGMYNLINGQFLTNQGTGADFIVGPDKTTIIEVENSTGIVGLYSKGEVVRDALKGGDLTPEIDKAGTIIGRDTNGKITFVGYDDFIKDSFDTTKFTPISVLVIPSSHTKDGKCRGVSLMNMAIATPEQGSNATSTMYWGVYGNDEKLTNFSSATTGNVPVGDTLGITANPYLPTDRLSAVPSVVDTEGGVAVSSYGTNTPYMPSPYMANGRPNPQYWEGSAANKIQCNTNMNGEANTQTIIDVIAQSTAQGVLIPNSGAIANAQANYPAFACCYRYQGGGYTDHSWYLPSCGELGYYIVRWGAINDALTAIRTKYGASAAALVVSGTYHWSSTEYNANGGRIAMPKNGYIVNNNKNTNYAVRAFHAF